MCVSDLTTRSLEAENLFSSVSLSRAIMPISMQSLFNELTGVGQGLQTLSCGAIGPAIHFCK